MKLSVREVLGAARLRVWNRLPYFMELLFKLKPVASKRTQGIAVDEGLRLWYSPEFVEKYGVEDIPVFLAHEVQHIMRCHPARARTLEAGGWKARYERVASIIRQRVPLADNWQRFLNIVGDCEINDDMETQGWEFPADWPPLKPTNYGLQRGCTMEEYATDIIAWAERQPAEPGEGGLPGGEKKKGEEGTGGPAGAEVGDGEGEGEGEAEGDAQHSDSPGDDAQDERDGDGDDGEGDAGDAAEDGEKPERHDEAADGDGGGGSDAGGTGGAAGVGQGGCGGCCGNPQPVELHNGDEGADLPDPATPEELEIAIMQVAQNILSYDGRGDRPGSSLLSWVKKMTSPPKVDWRRLLTVHCRSAVSSARGHTDWKVGPPSRRREVLKVLGFGEEAPILPVLRGPDPKTGVVIDTSGSMGSGKGSRLARVGEEVLDILKHCRSQAFGMGVDAQVQAARRLRTRADIEKLMKGGGGTNMPVGVRAMAEHHFRPEVIVLLTDGETPWPTEDDMPKNARLITVVVNERDYYFNNMPAHMKRRAVYVNSSEV